MTAQEIWTRRTSVLILTAVCVLFLAANRKAYLGYFEAGDLKVLGRVALADAGDFAKAVISPRRAAGGFRPVGHYYHYAKEQAAGLNFWSYVLGLHAFHLGTVVMLWWLARKIGLRPPSAVAAALLLFALHPALFDAFWHPALAPDVLCGFLGLASLAAYAQRRWILSFAFFWLAAKAHETALLLPLALVCYEMCFGGRKWKRPAAFLLVTVLFGAQAAMSHTAPAVAPWRSLLDYSTAVLVIPNAGLLLLAAPLVVRDRRVYFGASLLYSMAVPVLLPEVRESSAHLYLPLAGASLALAGMLDRFAPRPAMVATAVFMIWIPATYMLARPQRGVALTAALDDRVYVETLAAWTREHGGAHVFVCDGAPSGLPPAAVGGLLRYLYRRHDVPIVAVDAPAARDAVVLGWDGERRKLEILLRSPGTPDASYLDLGRPAPLWQLEEGWYGRDGRFRWTKPYARARLARPAGSNQFEVVLNLGADFIREVRTTKIEVLIDGRPLGAREFSHAGVESVRWPVEAAPAGTVRIEFRVQPEFRPSSGDPRVLGIPIVSFGFTTAGTT